jgi:hypothetical protein
LSARGAASPGHKSRDPIESEAVVFASITIAVDSISTDLSRPRIDLGIQILAVTPAAGLRIKSIVISIHVLRIQRTVTVTV